MPHAARPPLSLRDISPAPRGNLPQAPFKRTAYNAGICAKYYLPEIVSRITSRLSLVSDQRERSAICSPQVRQGLALRPEGAWRDLLTAGASRLSLVW